ncbi:zinc-binding dehydrogenase [Solitalea sp. MAHUQ-68]|uniref:Zinc-binding dehydrogenase n=1 Tax=Solitalea agri TaxID=2953739 RepID=A0A9X2F4B8_9SPHI|nr:zinc-binding dehydrogenase [Solitalea agri]MCO4294492.1 zinc-binding dehydrogenase [Solitalea agri]
MKALILNGLKEPLTISEVEKPVLKEDEVLVRIKAAAFNHRDKWIQEGLYAGIKYPIILGSDGAGIVAELGSNVDKTWLNQEVIINPSFNWGDNAKAQSKEFKILGLPHNGTLCEFALCKAEYLYKKPAHLNFEESAAIPLAGLTAFRALFTRAATQPREKVLINGIGGGVALFALQYAVAEGCEVYVTSGSDEKIEKAKFLGAYGGVNYKTSTWVDDLKLIAGGFDVIVDSAAGEGFKNLVELANPGGRIVFYGATTGTIKELDPRRIFWKQLSILGSTMGTQKDFQQMLNFIEQHKLLPVVDKVFDLTEANEALDRMRKAEQFGKIVIKID